MAHILKDARLDLPNVISSYWRDRSIADLKRITTAVDLWDFLEKLRQSAAKHLTNGETSENQRFYYRGQSDISYGFTSSLYREARIVMKSRGGAAVDPLEKITEKTLNDAEQAMLAEAREQGLGRRMSAIQLVALMQHHLMPTRLIDVSNDPFEALFFAVERNFDHDAVLFIAMPRNLPEDDLKRWSDSDRVRTPGRDDSKDTDLPWQGLARGQTQSAGEWTNLVVPIDLPSLDPRMQAQSGVFLSGGLFRNYRGVYYDDKRPGSSGNSGLRDGVNPEMSNLAIFWTKQLKESENYRFGATGWVIVIPADHKRELLKKLEKEESISPDSMYPPVDEATRLLKNVAGTSFGKVLS